MTVTRCQFFAKTWNGVPSQVLTLAMDSVNEKTTPEQFDAIWQWKKRSWNLNICPSAGEHPMMVAARHSNIPLIVHLHGMDKTLVNLGGSAGVTPLLTAVWYKKYPVTEKLLQLGANPNLASLRGITCLWAAAKTWHVTMSVLLLKYGAITEPALDDINSQKTLELAKNALALERLQLTTAITGATQVFATPLLQLIVEYV